MKRLAGFRFARVALALAAPLLMSCKEDSIVGNYAATTFTYAPAGGTSKDVIAAGGSINLTIYHDYSTSGSIQIPASVTAASAYSASLLGGASKNGSTVTFAFISDTFLRDMTFTVDGDAMTGTGTFSGTTVVVTLSK